MKSTSNELAKKAKYICMHETLIATTTIIKKKQFQVWSGDQFEELFLCSCQH